MPSGYEKSPDYGGSEPRLGGWPWIIRGIAVMVGLAILLSGCNGGAPEHYYVLCDGKDAKGWNLISTAHDRGYLISCTYQSPDKTQAYTVSCRSDGCD